MTKSLADENIPPAIVGFLRDKGLDVTTVHETNLFAATDSLIIKLASEQERALLTFDKHFSNILLYPPSIHHGIIRIRIHPPLLQDVKRALEHFFEKFDLASIKGRLVILEHDGFRVHRG
jgi:predicted nuclease of predicted toxin-antitoxin system